MNDYLTNPHFNPRPRKEGDENGEYCEYIRNISIHALVKRATKAVIHRFATAGISIHALVKRATKKTVGRELTLNISIHALVKRATQS